MANFATQLKDRFLGLVGRVTGCGGRGGAAAAGGDKDLPETTKLPEVQGVKIRPRDPNVPDGSKAGVN